MMTSDSDSKISIDVNGDFSALLQDGDGKEVPIPPCANKNHREVREELNDEARKMTYAEHLMDLYH